MKKELDKELKAKWVAALRSGDYQQLSPGGADWRRNGKHCCIGVLGEVLEEHDAMDSHCFRSKLAELGLSGNSIDKLTEMNDSHGSTFAEIADHIEANL